MKGQCNIQENSKDYARETKEKGDKKTILETKRRGRTHCERSKNKEKA